MENLLLAALLPILGKLKSILVGLVAFATGSYWGWFILGAIGCLVFHMMQGKHLQKFTFGEKLFMFISLSILLGPLILVALSIVLPFRKILDPDG